MKGIKKIPRGNGVKGAEEKGPVGEVRPRKGTTRVRKYSGLDSFSFFFFEIYVRDMNIVVLVREMTRGDKKNKDVTTIYV